MPYRKFVSALVGVAACTALVVTDASAQSSHRDGRRHGEAAISHTAHCVAATGTFEPQTRGFYTERIHMERITPRIVTDSSRYGHDAHRFNRYDTSYTASTTTASVRQEVDTNVPYGWIHASVPYADTTAVTDRCSSHGGVWTDTSDAAWPATTTSDR
jgi:hypothetical protein